MDYTLAILKGYYMHITKQTREEIAALVAKGYNKGFAKDGDDNTIIWELTTKLER